jgi:hypothetical protein
MQCDPEQVRSPAKSAKPSDKTPDAALYDRPESNGQRTQTRAHEGDHRFGRNAKRRQDQDRRRSCRQ